MSYSTGAAIDAADLNSFLETTRRVYATGTGNRGYGQTAVSQANVAVGSPILASHWSSLATMISTCATHQGTSVTLPSPTAGTTIAFASGLSSAVTAIDTNRLTAAPGGMTLTTAARTITRATPWGSGANSNINCTARATWASEDAMRHFFNTGGQIRVRLAQGTVATTQDTAWATIFSGIGTISISHNSTTRSGTLGTVPGATTGFYQLVTTDTLLFSGSNIGTGAYSTNDVTVTAKVGNVTGTNGGNGTYMQIIVALSDDHSNAFFDTVRENTQAIFDVYKSNLPNVAAPTWTTDDSF